jgi:Predicted membrane protein
VKRIVQSALFTAILFVVTTTVSIPIVVGFVNLSDTIIFLCASVLPLQYSLLVAGIGTSLADVFLGYGQYAIFTFFIKSFEAVIVAKMHTEHTVIKFILAGIFMMFSYALVDCFLLGSTVPFFPSLFYNGLQATVSIVLAQLFVKRFIQYFKK